MDEIEASAVERRSFSSHIVSWVGEMLSARTPGVAMFAVEELGLETSVAEFADRSWLVGFFFL